MKKVLKQSSNTIEGDITKLDDSSLLSLRVSIDAEFAKRGLVINVGEMGEKLCVEYLNSKPGLPKLIQSPHGAKNVDALSRDGDRYSIKTFMKAKKTGTIYPDKDDKKQLFEYLLVVQLSNRYQLKAIYRYSWKDFLSVRAWDVRMNAWYIPLSKRKLSVSEIIYEETQSKLL
jgi:hypothetical protein